MAINYFDRVLSHKVVCKESVELVALLCFYLASSVIERIGYQFTFVFAPLSGLILPEQAALLLQRSLRRPGDQRYAPRDPVDSQVPAECSFSFHDAPSHHGEVSPGPLVLDRLLVPERNLQEYGVLCAVHPLGYHSIGFEQKTLAYGALYSAWYLKESTPVPEMMLRDCHISLGSFYEITSILRNQESLSVVDAAYIYSLAQENSYYTKQSLQLEEKSSKSSPNNILACAEDL